MLKYLFPDHTEVVSIFGLIAMFVVTFISIIVFSRFLPRDLGRDFAFNGKKSQGKPRGAGIIFVTVFFVMALLFCRFQWGGVPFSWETLIYLLLIMLGMITGYLDDRSDSPWGEYLKGFLDFVIALGVAVTYLLNNPGNAYYDFYSWKTVDAETPAGRHFARWQNGNVMYEGNFSDSMPEPDFDNPMVRQTFLDVALFYIDLGVDGFRFDAAKYI